MNETKPIRAGDGSGPSASAKPVSSSRPPASAASVKPTSAPSRPGANAPERPAAAGAGRSPEGAKPDPARPHSATGQVVYDERGNAVWDWLKQTGRNAIESTTRLLRKLEAPELKVEQTTEEELRIQPDSGTCSGGGYDPYNQPIKSRRSSTK